MGFENVLSGGTFLGSLFSIIIGAWIIFSILGLALYIFTSICWHKIGEKLNHPYPWTAWFAHLVLIMQLSEQPWWWLFLMGIPIVNLILLIIILMKILERLEKPTWWVIWFIIPIANLIVLGVLGLSGSSPSQSYREKELEGGYEPYSDRERYISEETIPLGVKEPGFGVLIVEHGLNKGQSYKLAPNSTNVIGRAGNIQLPASDRTASREHARIRDENGKFVLYDLGSTNKTLVNNQRVDRKVLIDGDIIKIGQTVFRFQWIRNK